MSRTITTDDLAQRVDDAARAPFILDVRATEQFERWRIERKTELVMENIPYWTALTDLGHIIERLPEHEQVVVVCAHGGSSGMVAEMVDRPNVHNLEGGMDAWANTLVPRTLFDDGSQFVEIGPKGSSLLIPEDAVFAQRAWAISAVTHGQLRSRCASGRARCVVIAMSSASAAAFLKLTNRWEFLTGSAKVLSSHRR